MFHNVNISIINSLLKFVFSLDERTRVPVVSPTRVKQRVLAEAD
jgi:hypothetical protein